MTLEERKIDVKPTVEIDMPKECMSRGCHRPALPFGLYVMVEDGVEFWAPCKIHVEKLVEMSRAIGKQTVSVT